MNSKILGVLALCLSTLNLQAQLKFKSKEPNEAYNVTGIVDETTGLTVNNNLVPPDERIAYAHGDKIFTHKFLSPIEGIIKKYDLIGGRAVEIGQLLCPRHSISYFTKSGNLLITDSDDGPMREIKLYNDNFQLLRTITPFSGWFGGPSVYGSDNTITIGLNPVGHNNSKLLGISLDGSSLFEIILNINERIIRVLSCDDLFAINIVDEEKGIMELRVFDKTGKELWSKGITEESSKWSFSKSNSPTLITATQFELVTYNALTGEETSRKKLTEIIKETGANPFRNDGSVDVDIKPLEDGQMALLVFETTGVSETKNNILCLFKDKLHSNDQKIYIGNTKGVPRLILTKNEVRIIKDQELLKYEISSQK